MIEGRAVRIREPGDVSVLELVSRRFPAPALGQVRVAVKAAGLNRADVLQRRGLYPAPPGVPTDVPGLEYAGVIEALGEGVEGCALRDRVMGITGGGAMASHVLVHHRELVAIPEALSFEEAAAIPEAFFTAWDALFVQAQLRPGMTVLVHAIGSGIGTAVLQIATRVGARVIGTSRTADKLARCREVLGLTDGVLVGAAPDGPSFSHEVLALTAGRGVDLVIDTVGGAYLEENVNALAPRGVIVCLGLLAGTRGTLPMGQLLAKRASIVGSVLRSRPLEEKIALALRVSREALPWIARAELVPIVHSVFPIEEIALAHGEMERGENLGKIVLRLS